MIGKESTFEGLKVERDAVTGTSDVPPMTQVETLLAAKADATALAAALEADHDPVTVADTDTIDLTLTGQAISGAVKMASGSALKSDANGLAVDLGTGSTQAAAGDHTHAEFHDPVTIGTPPQAIVLALDGQELTGEITLRANSGLVLDAAGLGADWTQISGSSHSHNDASGSNPGFMTAAEHLKLEAISDAPYTAGENTESIAVHVVGHEITADVLLGTGLKIADPPAGVEVDFDLVAAADHTHDLVGSSVSGFISAEMNQKLSDLPFIYVRYASTNTGDDFSATFDPAVHKYIGILQPEAAISDVAVGDFAGTWASYGLEAGQYSKNVLRIASPTKDGETITIGDQIYEIDTSTLSGVLTGNLRVDLSPTRSVKAHSHMTVAGQPTAGKKITVGSTQYTFVASGPGAGKIVIGASIGLTQAAIIAAIDSGGEVTAGAFSSNVSILSAVKGGTAGNSLATITESGTNVTFAIAGTPGSTTLAEGLDPTATDSSEQIVNAINANENSTVDAYLIGANEVLIVHKSFGVNALACASTLTGANNGWASGTNGGVVVGDGNMYGGAAIAGPTNIRMESRVPNATEATLETLHFYFPFAPRNAMISVRVTATGIPKAWNGGYVIVGNRVTANNDGVTDWSASDTVTVMAMI